MLAIKNFDEFLEVSLVVTVQSIQRNMTILKSIINVSERNLAANGLQYQKAKPVNPHVVIGIRCRERQGCGDPTVPFPRTVQQATRNSGRVVRCLQNFRRSKTRDHIILNPSLILLSLEAEN